MRDLGQRMIDDQAKGTIPVYFKRPNAFPQDVPPSRSQNMNDLSLVFTSSTLDLLDPVQDNSNHQTQVGDARWTRLRGNLDEAGLADQFASPFRC